MSTKSLIDSSFSDRFVINSTCQNLETLAIHQMRFLPKAYHVYLLFDLLISHFPSLFYQYPKRKTLAMAC